MGLIGHRAPAGTARQAVIGLCTLLLHLAIYFWLSAGAPVERGVAGGTRAQKASRPAARALTVSIVTDRAVVPRQPVQLAETNPTAASSDPPAGADSKSANAPSFPEQSESHYWSPGSLTRVPAPLADIDLDVAGINDLEPAGEVELTILINADGTVDEVLGVPASEAGRAFAERVAVRFRSARFSPGEINGRAVKSQLRITVLSVPTAANRRPRL